MRKHLWGNNIYLQPNNEIEYYKQCIRCGVKFYSLSRNRLAEDDDLMFSDNQYDPSTPSNDCDIEMVKEIQDS